MPLTEEEKKERKLAKTAEWRRNNPDRIKALAVNYYKKHKKRISTQNKEWKDSNPCKVKARNKEYYQENVQHYNELSNKYNKELTDSNVRKRICSRTLLESAEIPQSLINAKRAYIKGTRLIKEQEDERQKDQECRRPVGLR
jgi:hypothetical protein